MEGASGKCEVKVSSARPLSPVGITDGVRFANKVKAKSARPLSPVGISDARWVGNVVAKLFSRTFDGDEL